MGDVTVNINTLFGWLAAIAGAIGAITLIYKYLKKGVGKLAEDTVNEVVDARTVDLEKSIKDLQKSVNNLADSFNMYTEESNKDMADIKKTLCDEVREKINRIHRECIKSGYISEHQLFIVNELWDDYNNRLNGNTFVGGLVEDLQDLYKECHKEGNDHD